ncbi:MAG: DUF1467 family protein [Dongiaceae bacterium]
MSWLIPIVFVYFVVWWQVWFIVLPFMHQGASSHPQPGNDRGAPDRPRLKRGLFLTSGISVLITALLLGLFKLLVVRGII